MILMQTVTNVMSILIPQSLAVYAIAVVVAVIFVVAGRMWRRIPASGRAIVPLVGWSRRRRAWRGVA